MHLNPTSPKQPKPFFDFLSLPPEIREKIYIYLSTTPYPINLSHPNYIPPKSLLQTNEQIYHEARPLFFAHNTFSLQLQRHARHIAYFFAPEFLDNRRQIRSLDMAIHRWGANDFFAKEAAPILEDMVLNGSLRRLSVSVREKDALQFERMVMGEVNEVENWKVLRRLLRDPYLEKMTLRTLFSSAWSNDLVNWHYRGEHGCGGRDITWMVHKESAVDLHEYAQGA